MDRRGLLKFVLGATAAPLLGPKAAAHALGVSLATNAAPILDAAQSSTGLGPASPSIGTYWGSPLQMSIDARRAARYEAGQNIGRYAHFKSWGPAFREAVIAREELAVELLRRKMERDESFAERALAAFGGWND